MRDFLRKLAAWVRGDLALGLDDPTRFGQESERKAESGSRTEHTVSERTDRRFKSRNTGVPGHAGALPAVPAFLFAALIIFALLLTLTFLPSFGDPDSPTNNEVSRQYIENGIVETGSVNFVGGILLKDRALDTFGGSVILFMSLVAVMALLQVDRKKKGQSVNAALMRPKKDAILQKAARILVPGMLLFGIYVILSGHRLIGGGFPGGAILGAALILYVSAFGSEGTGSDGISRKGTDSDGSGREGAAHRLSYRTFFWICVCALVFLGIVNGYVFYSSLNGPALTLPLGKTGEILSGGWILLQNIAIGIVTCCTLFGFFAYFAGRE